MITAEWIRVRLPLSRQLVAAFSTVIVAMSGVAFFVAPARASEPIIAQSSLEWPDSYNHFLVLPQGSTSEIDPSPAVTASKAKTGVTGPAAPRAGKANGLDLPDGAVVATDTNGTQRVITADGRILVLPKNTTPTTETAPQPVTPPAKTLTPAKTITGGAAGRGSSERFASLARTWPGVISAQPLTNGMISVSTTLSSSEVEARPEVGEVRKDSLLKMTSVATGEPNDPFYAKQWVHENTGDRAQAGGHSGTVGNDVNTPTAWTSTTGTNVLVADIDSGVDVDHPDLRDRIWGNAGETCGNGRDDDNNGYVDDCMGWDAGDNDADPRPTGSGAFGDHGTHVAGIIGATGDNGIGLIGVAPGATIMPVKIASGENLAVSSLYSAIVYAVDNGAKVINASWGTPPGYSRDAAWALEAAVRYAHDHGVLIVAAAGNDGLALDSSPSWPASFARYYDNVLTVAASDNNDTRASFSNYGKQTAGVFAPGFFIASTVRNGYAFMSGTSMAAPVVSGGAALLLAAEPTLTPAQIVVRMKDSTADGAGLPNFAQSGRIDLGRVVAAAPLTVHYSGANALRPGTDGEIRTVTRIQTDAVASQAKSVRAQVVTSDGTDTFAISGLLLDATGTESAVPAETDDRGEATVLPRISASELTAGRTGNLRINFTVNLPAGDYALGLQLIGADGTPVSNASTVYFRVAPGATATDDSPSGTGTGGSTTPGSDGSGPGGGSGSRGDEAPAANEERSGHSGANSGDSSSDSGTGGSNGGGTTPGASEPIDTGSGTTPAGADSVSTPSAPGTASPNPGVGSPATMPPTPEPDVPSASVGPVSGPTSSGGATPSSGSPASGGTPSGGGTATPTTPGPTITPVTEDGWSIYSVTPSRGYTTGGQLVTIQGWFPNFANSYVRIGGSAATMAGRSQTQLTVFTPLQTSGLKDVTVAAPGVSVTANNAFLYVVAGGSGDGVADYPQSGTGTSPSTTLTPRRATQRGTVRLTPVPKDSMFGETRSSVWNNRRCTSSECPGRNQFA